MEATKDHRQWLTLDEVASALHCSGRTIARALHRGEIPERWVRRLNQRTVRIHRDFLSPQELANTRRQIMTGEDKSQTHY